MKKTDKPANQDKNVPHIETVGSLHRIVSGDLASQWFNYQQVAVLKTPTTTYYAATDYHHGNLPTGKIFTIAIV